MSEIIGPYNQSYKKSNQDENENQIKYNQKRIERIKSNINLRSCFLLIHFSFCFLMNCMRRMRRRKRSCHQTNKKLKIKSSETSLSSNYYNAIKAAIALPSSTLIGLDVLTTTLATTSTTTSASTLTPVVMATFCKTTCTTISNAMENFKVATIVSIKKYLVTFWHQRQLQLQQLRQGICLIRLITLKRFQLKILKPVLQHQHQHQHQYQHQHQLQQHQQEQHLLVGVQSNKKRKLQRTLTSLNSTSPSLHLSHFRPETSFTTKCSSLSTSLSSPASASASKALSQNSTSTSTSKAMATTTNATTHSPSWQRKQQQRPVKAHVTSPTTTTKAQASMHAWCHPPIPARTQPSLTSTASVAVTDPPQIDLHGNFGCCCCCCCCSSYCCSCWHTLRRIPVSSERKLAWQRVYCRSCWSIRPMPPLPSLAPTLQRLLLLLFVLSALWLPCAECFHGSVKMSTNTVKTKYGLLRGIVVRSTPLVEAYLGIPYASPPVGSLRFMPPITPSTWKTVRNSDRFSPVCPQTVPIPPDGPEALLEVPRSRLAQLRRLLPLLKNQSEDCLYLNIYVPNETQRYKRYATNSAEKDDSPKLSTVVFIHGESYDWSSGNPYDGSELAAHGNVIVVTINFRLGIFGFLKTGGKESAQGNFGLMDLVAGLHWLKENLPAFGGDPQSITLFGYGTGAVLANILAVSPVASDLVQRTVLISGSALSPWAIQKNPLFVKRRVAEQTGCHGDLLYDDLAPCLRTKSVSELLAVKVDHPRFLVGFAPFVDGTVISPITDSIGTITLPMGSAIVSTSGIEYANFPKRDLIFCLTSVESYLDLSAQDLEFGFNETRRDRILRTFVRNNYHYHLNEIFAVLKNEYTDWEKAIRNPLSSRDAALSFLSDGHTASSLIKLGYMHSLRGGRTYFLHFKHRTIEEEYPQRTGSVRGEDVPFWLGLPISPLFPHNYTTQEKQISRLMLRYLANFAKTGNPNQSTPSATLPTTSATSTIQKYMDHQKVKRAAKIQNATSSPGKIRESAINLAVLYNQRRSNAMREKRTYYRRHLRSNDDNAPEITFDAEESEIGGYEGDEMPFWDAYDIVNQLYLELGNKANIQSHYRGHKLSMWLNLIPQLHRHFNINDQSMRHHQFQDDMNNRDLYEGVVRPQIQTKPADDEETVLIQTPRTSTPSAPVSPPRSASPNKTNIGGALLTGGTTTTTECGIDGALYISELTTTQAPKGNRTILETQKDMATASTGIIGNLEVLRRLGGKQFQSYTTALIATVAVGCFLLILNVLIFAGIYHQREKRARDAKTKEELQDSDTSKNSSIIKLNTLGGSSGDPGSSYSGGGLGIVGSASGKTSIVFGEYNCYDEKTKQLKDEKLLVELPPPQTTLILDAAGTWTACSTSTLDLLKTKQHIGADHSFTLGGEQSDVHIHPINTMEMSSYNPIPIAAVMEATGATSAPHSKRGSFIDTSNIQLGGQFDYAVQSSDQLSFKDIENAVKSGVSDADIMHDDDIPEPPPPPRSYNAQQQQQQQQQQSGGGIGGGILRQANINPISSSSGTAPSGGNKKRVHIQEISV